MEFEIIDEIYKDLQTNITNLNLGYYPYDYEFIGNNLPSLLIKLGDKIVQAKGHGTYDVFTTTQFILYTIDGIQKTLQLQQSILHSIISSLHDMTNCIIDINDTNIQSGDINDYQSPSQTGYNANIIVRKISQSYTFRLTII